jgi:hypothetical protein
LQKRKINDYNTTADDLGKNWTPELADQAKDIRSSAKTFHAAAVATPPGRPHLNTAKIPPSEVIMTGVSLQPITIKQGGSNSNSGTSISRHTTPRAEKGKSVIGSRIISNG